MWGQCPRCDLCVWVWQEDQEEARQCWPLSMGHSGVHIAHQMNICQWLHKGCKSEESEICVQCGLSSFVQELRGAHALMSMGLEDLPRIIPHQHSPRKNGAELCLPTIPFSRGPLQSKMSFPSAAQFARGLGIVEAARTGRAGAVRHFLGENPRLLEEKDASSRSPGAQLLKVF